MHATKRRIGHSVRVAQVKLAVAHGHIEREACCRATEGLVAKPIKAVVELSPAGAKREKLFVGVLCTHRELVLLERVRDEVARKRQLVAGHQGEALAGADG